MKYNTLMKFFIKTLIPIAAMSIANAQAESLISLYNTALKNDSNYLSKLSQIDSIKEKENQIKSFLYPKITANASINWRDRNKRDYLDKNLGLSLNQAIFNKGTLHKLKKTDYAIQTTNQQLSLYKQDLILKVSKAYFDILQALDTIDTQNQETNAIRQQLTNIKQKYKAGVLTRTDVMEAEARLDLIKSKNMFSKTTLLIAQEKLQEITGSTVGQIKKLRNNIQTPLPQPQNVEDWVAIAKKNNPQIKMQQNSIYSAREEVDIQKSFHYPSLNLTASINRNFNDISGQDISTDNKSIGLNLTVPIFNGGYNSSKVKESQHLLQANLHDLKKTSRSIISNTRAAYYRLSSNINQIQAAKQLVKSSNSLLNSISTGFKAGLRTTSEVLNAKSNMYSAKLTLSKYIYSYLYNVLQLKFTAGVLSKQDLYKINSLLK